MICSTLSQRGYTLVAILIVKRRRMKTREHFEVEMIETGSDEEAVEFQIIEDFDIERDALGDKAKE